VFTGDLFATDDIVLNLKKKLKKTQNQFFFILAQTQKMQK